jgi:hypothetical protein
VRVISEDLGGGQTILLADEVLDIAGLGFDGVRGYSILKMAARRSGSSWPPRRTVRRSSRTVRAPAA